MTALVILQDEELYYFGSRAAWMRWGGDRFRAPAAEDEVEGKGQADASCRDLPHPGISRSGISTSETSITAAISPKVELNRKTEAFARIILGGVSAVA